MSALALWCGRCLTIYRFRFCCRTLTSGKGYSYLHVGYAWTVLVLFFYDRGTGFFRLRMWMQMASVWRDDIGNQTNRHAKSLFVSFPLLSFLVCRDFFRACSTWHQFTSLLSLTPCIEKTILLPWFLVCLTSESGIEVSSETVFCSHWHFLICKVKRNSRELKACYTAYTLTA